MKRMHVLALSTLFLASVSSLASANVLLNGSFELSSEAAAPVTNYNGWGVNINALPPGTDGLTNWTVVPGNTRPEYYWYWANTGATVAQDGTRFMNITSDGDTAPERSISQSFAVQSGVQYTVSFYGVERTAGASLKSAVTLAAGAGAADLTVTPGTAWTQYTFNFTPDTSTTATLWFIHAGGSSNGSFLDTVDVTAVPEPASIALLTLGGLGMFRRNRR